MNTQLCFTMSICKLQNSELHPSNLNFFLRPPTHLFQTCTHTHTQTHTQSQSRVLKFSILEFEHVTLASFCTLFKFVSLNADHYIHNDSQWRWSPSLALVNIEHTYTTFQVMENEWLHISIHGGKSGPQGSNKIFILILLLLTCISE